MIPNQGMFYEDYTLDIISAHKFFLSYRNMVSRGWGKAAQEQTNSTYEYKYPSSLNNRFMIYFIMLVKVVK
jgi:hypothetical protein